jgi:glutamate racemase
MGEIPKYKVLLGIFDSGVGGFTVYRKIKKVTRANCIYYGDCLRAPYGNREEQEIVSFIKDDIQFLQEKGVTHFVNACNSMSVLTTNNILKECNVKPDTYIDMIRAFDAHAVFPFGSVVLVIATAATIRSGAYQEVLTKKGVASYSFVYEDLASAIENNASREELFAIVERSILYAQSINATHSVYGCTHYPLVGGLFEEVKEKLRWRGEFVDPAFYVAEEVKHWNLKGERSFCPYTSKDTPAFIKNIITFL